ncbi:SPOR domain-containing protein [Sphingomonas sp. AX6]|uniref:SPOR domain-containing protein n=1 Tax=Sphingomonas sp. AX6 TaxID=2653171 RepID=UPI0012F02D2F|nr:SPOR domain-containing protein [Sphingomonas sp. AX6]VXC96345.1 Sporulation related domain-containing protein [Sphingomonas sp. AX6]
MKSRAELFLLPLAAFALGGAASQDMPVVPDGVPSGSSQVQPGEERVDQVGYARAHEGAAPPRIAAYAAHATLNAGDFVEVTALDSGKTILVAVTEQAALPAGTVVRLSPVAASQLGLELSKPAPVRVRALAPTAQDEAALVSGGAAPTRLDAPAALLTGLRAMLPAGGAPVAVATTAPAAIPTSSPAASPTPAPKPSPSPVATTTPTPRPTPAVQPARTGRFVVQVGTFSSAANAKSLATRLGGFTDASGALTRVRMGPFVTRADADAARTKAIVAGYRDATVVRSN